MATAATGDDAFDEWLSLKLKSFNSDDSVISSYVKGILEGEEEDETEKMEALLGILAEIATGDVEALCQEIVKKWLSYRSVDGKIDEGAFSGHELEEQSDPHLEDKIAQMMIQQAENSVRQKSRANDSESEVKKAILAQYSEVCDEEEDDEEKDEEAGEPEGAKAAHVKVHQKPLESQQDKEKGNHGQHGHGHQSQAKPQTESSGLLSRNTNAENVAKAEKERREKARVEAEKKRQQDKLNKEKQKQDAADRKEKEKKRTQKGERRR